MIQSDKDKFLPALKGIPASIVVRVISRHHPGYNWIGCSKSTIQKFLFGGILSGVAAKLPPLARIQNECLLIQVLRNQDNEVSNPGAKQAPRTQLGCQGCGKLRKVAVGLLEWIDASKSVMMPDQERLMRWESIERARRFLNQTTKPIEANEL